MSTYFYVLLIIGDFPKHIGNSTNFWYHYHFVLGQHKFTCMHSTGGAIHAIIKNILLSWTIIWSPLGPVTFQTAEHSWEGVCFLEYCIKKAVIGNSNALSYLLRTQNCTCGLYVQFAIFCISSSVQESRNSTATIIMSHRLHASRYSSFQQVKRHLEARINTP